MPEPGDRPYDPIDQSRRYVLGQPSGEDWEGYGIWDRRAGNSLVERFPPTEEGVEQALQRFEELKWEDRRERWNLPRLARICAVAGAAIWIVGGVVGTVLLSFVTGPDTSWIAPVLFGLDALGFRLAIGSLVVLGVLLLLRWTQGTEEVLASPPALRATGPNPALDLALRVVVVAGLVVWIASSVGTEALFRLEFGPFGESPRPSAVVAQLVSTMAFRTWVAGVVFSILLRLPLQRRAPTSSQDDED